MPDLSLIAPLTIGWYVSSQQVLLLAYSSLYSCVIFLSVCYKDSNSSNILI
nr:MAG TPA: hypothetical protein [Caudoviricetes sp.]